MYIQVFLLEINIIITQQQLGYIFAVDLKCPEISYK